MLKEKKEIIEEKIVKHTNMYDIIYCDLCNEKIGKYARYDNGRNIEFDEFDAQVDKPIIGMLTEWYDYGDSRGKSGETFDICKDCYEKKIKPLLKKELGIEPRDVEFDE